MSMARPFPALTAALMIAMASGCQESSTPIESVSSAPSSTTQPVTTEPVTPPSPSAATAPAATRPAASQPDGQRRPDPPSTSRPAMTDADPERAEFLDFAAPKPATWRRYPAENRMRAGNWVVPGASGEGQAHMVVFQGIGGDVDANVMRWRGQFMTEDGGPVTPVREDFEVRGIPITVVEFVGQQQRTGAAWFTPNQCMIGAIVQTERPIHITLIGPRETVQANRDAFMTFLRGIERR